jgi:hypothetical protein
MLRRVPTRRLRFSSKAGRTIVRDPRKKKNAPILSALQLKQDKWEREVQTPPQATPVPFAPSRQNQESVGSTLGSYALAGVGMTLGFALVRVLFGI